MVLARVKRYIRDIVNKVFEEYSKLLNNIDSEFESEIKTNLIKYDLIRKVGLCRI